MGSRIEADDVALQLFGVEQRCKDRFERIEKELAASEARCNKRTDVMEARLKEGADRMASIERGQLQIREDLSSPIDIPPDDSVRMKLGRVGSAIAKHTKAYGPPGLSLAFLVDLLLRLLNQ